MELQALDFDLALGRMLRNIQGEAFPNPIDGAIAHHLPRELKERVAELLKDDNLDWANGAAANIDLPRGDNLVRPISYLDVDVRLVYQALVDGVAAVVEPYIEERFNEQIFSHRIASPVALRMFKEPGEGHRRFLNAQHTATTGEEYSHCVKLDVANYYERIYQHDLHQLLERRGVPARIVSAISTLLRKFAAGDSHGIPQGLWPSDYLGNIYLLPLDEHLQDRGIYFVRFVDDYRIFCKSEREGQQILKDASRVLRDLGLSPQPLKTDIVTVDKLNPELKPITEQFEALSQRTKAVVVRYMRLNFYGDDVIEVEEEVDEGAPSALEEDDIAAFEKLWTEAIDHEHKRTALLRFALAGLAAGESPTAESHVLNRWADFPHLAPATARYLEALGIKESTIERLLSIVESPDCIYEYQQVWFLDYLRKVGILEGHLPRLVAIVRDRNRHPLVRSHAASVVAKWGTDNEGPELRRIFADEANSRVRRALLLGFVLLPETERNYLISYLPPTDWHLRQVGSLIKQGIQV